MDDRIAVAGSSRSPGAGRQRRSLLERQYVGVARRHWSLVARFKALHDGFLAGEEVALAVEDDGDGRVTGPRGDLPGARPLVHRTRRFRDEVHHSIGRGRSRARGFLALID